MGGASAVINAQIRAQDLASAVVRNFANTSRNAMSQIGTAQSQLTRTFVQANDVYNKNVENMKKYQQESERMGMSTGRLITMMVKFGIILKALQIATEPLRILGQGAKDLMELDVRTREIMGMLAERGDTAGVRLARYNQLLGASIGLQTKWGYSAQQVGLGLYDVASVITTLNIEGYAKTSSEAIVKLTNDAALLARGGFMPLNEATSGLTTVFNALDIPVSNVGQVMDIMFNAVKIGKGHMSDLTTNMGAFLNVLGDLTTEGNRMQAFQETMGIFGYLTTVISPARAGTATRRMLEGIASRSTQQGQLIDSIQSAFGIDLTASAFSEQGPRAYFEKLIGAVGPASPQLSALIQGRTGQAPTEAQMRAISTAILEQFTGDKRAAQAILALSRQDQFDKIWPVMAQRGSAAASEQEAMDAYQTKWEQFQQNIAAVGENLQMSILPKFMDFFGGVASVLTDTMGTQDFADMSSGGKVGAIFGNINKAFNTWFSGGQGTRTGRETDPSGAVQLRSMATGWGSSAAMLFAEAFGVTLPGAIKGQRSQFFAAGGELIGGLWQGFSSKMGEIFSGRGIMDAFGDMANSPLVRGGATFFGLTRIGVPWPLALALSLSSAASAGGTDLGAVGNTVATIAPIVGSMALLGALKKGLVPTVTSAANSLMIPQTASLLRRGWNAIPVPGDGGFIGPQGYLPSTPMRDSYGRFISQAEAYRRYGAPGMNIPGQGYMPPSGPYRRGGGSTSGGFGVGSRIGAGVGAAGGAFLEAGVGILVMTAFQQILETVMLIADNWDKFVYALKHGDLNNIPIFGALFNIVQKINDLWGLMFPNKSKALDDSTPEYYGGSKYRGSGLNSAFSADLTRPVDANGVPILSSNESMLKLGPDGKWINVAGGININLLVDPKGSGAEHAQAVYDAVVDLFSTEVGNAGRSAGPVITP